MPFTLLAGMTKEIGGVGEELTTSRVWALKGDTASCNHGASPLRHEMLLYGDGDHGFLDGTLDLVKQALAHGAPVQVAVDAVRERALREALADDAAHVQFADMISIGRNPARIIPILDEFVREHVNGGARALSISEPVWPGRSPAELEECERHEALLNVAFGGGPGCHLLCAYDVDGLDDHVIVAAKHTHPLLVWDGVRHENEGYTCEREPPRPFAGTLPPPRGPLSRLEFTSTSLAQVRHAVNDWAISQSLPAERAEDLVLAVDELATNSIRHGGGMGTLRYWREAYVLHYEVQDAGWITAPLVGRSRPTPDAYGGRGIWLANQLCDLVQIRSDPAGSVVRLHKQLLP